MINPLHANNEARKQGILPPKFKTRVTVPPPLEEGLWSFKNYIKKENNSEHSAKKQHSDVIQMSVPLGDLVGSSSAQV